jgi:hypothetical protein
MVPVGEAQPLVVEFLAHSVYRGGSVNGQALSVLVWCSVENRFYLAAAAAGSELDEHAVS